jgi:hypothetical protein
MRAEEAGRFQDDLTSFASAAIISEQENVGEENKK